MAYTIRVMRFSFDRFFPTPTILTLPAVGIDISDKSIKYTELVQTTAGFRLNSHGSVTIPQGVVVSGKIADRQKLKDIFTNIQRDARIGYAHVALPEEQVYLFSIKIPRVLPEEVRGAIELQLEEHVPIPAHEAVFDYSLIAEDKENYTFQVSAVSRELIESYLDIFRSANIELLSFELESQATVRAVVPQQDTTAMIVDFGETRTGISIASNKIVQFATTVDIGGEDLTALIAKTFHVSVDDAEKMKRQYGLEHSTEYPELYSTLLGSLAALRDEINKHFIYWHTHKDDTGHSRLPVQQVILCGGNANIKGLKEYLEVALHTSVLPASPWTIIADTNKYVPTMTAEESTGFATALGLALGNFEYD